MPEERASQEAKSRRVFGPGAGRRENSVSCRPVPSQSSGELMSDVAAETNHAKDKNCRWSWTASSNDVASAVFGFRNKYKRNIECATNLAYSPAI